MVWVPINVAFNGTGPQAIPWPYSPTPQPGPCRVSTAGGESCSPGSTPHWAEDPISGPGCLVGALPGSISDLPSHAACHCPVGMPKVGLLTGRVSGAWLAPALNFRLGRWNWIGPDWVGCVCICVHEAVSGPTSHLCHEGGSWNPPHQTSPSEHPFYVIQVPWNSSSPH